METMRFRETKRKSYKLHIFLLLMFFGLGTGLVYFAIKTEREPQVIGKQTSDLEEKKNLEEQSALVKVSNEPDENIADMYLVEKKEIKDSSNKKIKENISIPIISVKGVNLSTVNAEIEKTFSDTYATFKETMKNASNNFTYTVTYQVFENVIKNNNILTITIWERMVDDSNLKNSMEKIHAYNINLEDSVMVKQSDVIIDILGTNYKERIKDACKTYLINGNYIKESDYNYSYTGLETFYLNENKIHLIFNPGELVNKKYGVLNITI